MRLAFIKFVQCLGGFRFPKLLILSRFLFSNILAWIVVWCYGSKRGYILLSRSSPNYKLILIWSLFTQCHLINGGFSCINATAPFWFCNDVVILDKTQGKYCSIGELHCRTVTKHTSSRAIIFVYWIEHCNNDNYQQII